MKNKRSLPLWATPDRSNRLLELWEQFGNKCLLGHSVCPIPSHYVRVEASTVIVGKPYYLPCVDRQRQPVLDSNGKQLLLTLYKPVPVQIETATLTRLYDLKAEQVINDWIADDRADRHAEWIAEQKAIHSLGERTYPLRGQFNAISQTIYADQQPLYYIDGLGISGITLTPFAKVRISSSYVTLYIDLGKTLKSVSKARRRKAIRYGKPLPLDTARDVNVIVNEAVKHYIAH